MTILTMPASPGFNRTRFGLVSNTQTDLVSPITRTSQVLELPGARWEASYQLPPMTRAAAAAWQAFLVRLRGRAGLFYGYDPDGRTARGTAGAKAPGTLTVAGGSPGPSGSLLVLDGADGAEPGVFLEGDYLAFDVGGGRQLHMAVADADADSSGEVAVQIEPPIRLSPAAGAAVLVADAACVMRLSDDIVGWDADQISRYGIAFDAVEVLV